MMVQRICAQCGQTFETTLSRVNQGAGKHCSKACAASALRNRVTVQCATCAKPILRKPSDLVGKSHSYCSKACADKGLILHGEAQTTCKTCGTQFVYQRSKRRPEARYCSVVCRDQGMQRPLHQKACGVCGRTFETRDKKRKFCGPDCLAAYHRRNFRLVTCPICKRAYETARADQKYCSQECADKGRAIVVMRDCAQCSESFRVYSKHSRVQYCSPRCAKERRRQMLRKKHVFKTCEQCGKEYETIPSSAHRHHFCSGACRADSLKKRNRVVDFGTHLGLELVNNGRVIGYALVDREDYEKVEGYSWRSVMRGNQQGTLMSQKMVDGVKVPSILMHRLIMDPAKGMVVDHINHNRWDNRRCNLRLATYAQNSRNRRPNQRPFPTGVSKHPDGRALPYVAYIKAGNTRRSAYFATLQEAVTQRRMWEQELFGEFAYEESIRQGPATPAYASTMSAGGMQHVTSIV